MLKSHPHQRLSQHLNGVWQNVDKVMKRHARGFWTEDLRILTMIACFFHDLGKATSFFQRYMEKISQGQRIKGGSEERHSLLSAIIGYYLAKLYFEQKDSSNEDLPFYVYVAIKEHHGNLSDFNDEKNNISRENLELLEKQAESIDYNQLEKELSPLLSYLPFKVKEVFPLSKDIIINWIRSFNSELYSIRKKRNISFFKQKQVEFNPNKIKTYFTFCYLFSLLLEGDKSQAGIGETKENIKEIDPDLVDIFKTSQKWPASVLNDLRQEAYAEVEQNIDLSKRGSLFSINLPTGLGKTLTAYNFALKLRERRKNERNGSAPRIIYSLPFLSVIDQNLQIFEDILKTANIPYDHTYILKHHHLSTEHYTEKTKEEELIYSPNASKLLIEGWNSEIIVTTFIQLFESMISYRNRSLRRFHKLSNAIILIDEIQAIPVKYWELIRWMVLFISKKFNTDIILVTATTPKIFLTGDNVLDLCRSDRYFAQLNRITMQIDFSRRTIEEFADQLCIKPNKSYLFILNTISSAKKLYECLSHKVHEPIGFLSTQVIMKHRKKRIDDIKNSKYRIVVSTQMVEAGVDIDFDIVYRDFAPMDSINQSAGRCNRNNRQGVKGEVKIIKLSNGNKAYGDFIYDPILLKTTEKILEGKESIQENQFQDLIDLYFNLLRKRTNQESSQAIIKSVEELCFDSNDEEKYSISKFKLIEERGFRENVFVEIDKQAQKIWKKYEEVLKIEDRFTRQEEFSIIKHELYDYVISVPTNYDLPAEVNSFRYVSNNVLETYYDIETGFKDKAGTMIW